MQAIRAWMRENPKDARALMWENKSFVFFREVEVDDPDLGPPGAQKVALTPLQPRRRSLAVDVRHAGLARYTGAQGRERQAHAFPQLLVAQDTGTAIKGHAAAMSSGARARRRR